MATLTMLGTAPVQLAGHPLALAQTSEDHFEIFFSGMEFEFGRFTFAGPPWLFGDRAGYRCAWGFLMDGGVAVARVQFDRGQGYVVINDKFGDERDNDFSQCLEPEELEIKPKPEGLGDSAVAFVNAGATLTSLTFPATSPENAESWWELEEATADEVEMELYWRDEVIVIATITSLSPTLSFAATSSAPPTISSFSPTGGSVGTVVAVLGANFTGATSVTFNGVASAFTMESAGEIAATVPGGATTGPIAVTTPKGTATSAVSFTVAPPQTQAHESKVTLKLSGHLVASGVVDVPDGTSECEGGRTVVIERRISGNWKKAGKDETNDTGSYRAKVEDKEGTYRARVKQETLGNGDICEGAASKKRSP